MSIWIFGISLTIIILMMGLKLFELKRGKQSLISKKLLKADEVVVPKLTLIYNFFTRRGKRTLIYYLSQIYLFAGKGISKAARIVKEKSKALQDSSRGKYSLKNEDSPRSEFLKTMIEYKNGEKEKENGGNETQTTLK